MLGRQGQERQMTRPLDRQGEFALMPSASANLAARPNLAAIGEIAAQLFAVFVIDVLVFVFAVDADAPHGRTKAALTIASAVSARATVARGTWRATSTAAARLIFH